MNSFGLTDIGKNRATNQDYVFCSDSPIGNLPNLYIVADGMGGHNAGDLASEYTVNIFVNYVECSSLINPISILQEAISVANKALIEKSKESPAFDGMGTTLVTATIIDNILYVANVGDSRLYVLKDKLIQITKDHSLVEEMVSTGKIDKDSARLHVNKNIITKAMGVDCKLEADYFEIEIANQDMVLLCSDGLTNMLEDNLIEEIIHRENKLEEIVTELVEKANNSGGKDNISVILVCDNPS